MQAHQKYIRVNRLQFESSSTLLLKDCSFSIAQGEYVSIVGPNGAGKTTLLRLLAGIISASRGDIEIAGKFIHSYSRKELSRLIAYLPQKYSIFAPYTVREFLKLPRYAHLGALSGPNLADQKIIESIIENLGLLHLSKRSVISLSSGERQKVMLAAALAQEPCILMLDEPCTFLDPHHQEEIQAILLKLHKESKLTLIVVTHDVNSAVLYSDRILALQQGQLIFDQTPADFMQTACLTELFNVTPTLVKHPFSSLAMLVPTRLTV